MSVQAKVNESYSNQSVGEVLIPFIGPSPHGMMNASALETGPVFHSACGTFRRHKACYSFTIHRLSGPKQLCMSGLLKTTTPNCHSRESNPGLSSESPNAQPTATPELHTSYSICL